MIDIRQLKLTIQMKGEADMGIVNRSPSRSFEDVAVGFLGQHAGKIYLGLAVLATLVVGWHDHPVG
jgi:hypothetical protein